MKKNKQIAIFKGSQIRRHWDDEKGWIWLTKSFSGSRVVDAFWDPDDRRLGVVAFGPGDSDSGLGARLSRSFSS